jgi:hypothetical protein
LLFIIGDPVVNCVNSSTFNGFIGAFGLITDGANPDIKAYAFR